MKILITILSLLISIHVYGFDLDNVKSGDNISKFDTATEVTYKDTPLAIAKPGVKYYIIPEFTTFEIFTIFATKDDLIYRVLFAGFTTEEFYTMYLFLGVIYGEPQKLNYEDKIYTKWKGPEDSAAILFWPALGAFAGDIEVNKEKSDVQ